MAKSLVEIGRNECRWIEDDGLMCAKKTLFTKSWCKKHNEIVFHKQQGRAEANMHLYAKNAGRPGSR